MNLSTEQLQAVNHGNGPLLVLAGAGAGKTQTLAVRVAKLIERGARPSSILAVTFTNKAAKELRHRVQAIAGADSESVVMGTFHGLAARHLRPHPRAMGLTENWTILDDDEAKVIVKKLARALDEDADFALVHNLIQAARDRGLQIDDYLAKANIHGPAAVIAVAIWGKYHEQLLRINATDFPGLLLGWRKLYALDQDEVAGRYQHVIIDEYQDTNTIQDELVTRLAERHHNVWAVGDFRQCHPAGTMIALTGGRTKPIEQIQVGDELVSYQPGNSWFSGVSNQGRKVSAVAKRPLRGTLFKFRVGKQVFECTGEHKCYVRLKHGSRFVVYLMQKGTQFRIGVTAWSRTRQNHHLGFGIAERGRVERADCAWVLKSFSTKDAARAYEVYASCLYGIPQTVFYPGQHISPDFINSVFGLFGDLTARAAVCLKEHRLLPDSPLWTARTNNRWGRKSFITKACNVLDGLFEMRTFDGTTRGGAWAEAMVSTRQAICDVYSLELTKQVRMPLYVANGVVVHNCVYSWRSAQIENILTFPKRWPGCKVVLLSGNYRSTPEILNVANRLIKNGEKNSLAIDTDLKAMRPSGPAVRPYAAMDERDEASRVARTIGLMLDRGTAETKDIAVLYRTNAQSRILEQSLSKAGIPYQIVGGFSFWERAEIRDAMAYLRLCFNRNDDLAFGRVVNVPRRGLGGAAMDAIQNASTDHDVSLWAATERVILKPAQARAIAGFKGAIDAVDPKKDLAAILTTILDSIEYKKYLDTDEETASDRWNNIEELVSFVNEFPDLPALMEHAALMSGEDRDAPKDGVTLSTIHGAKGREWSVVFCVGWEKNIIPSPRSDFEEERRLAYVALTRAKDYLFAGGAKRRRNCEQSPSIFLKEAGLCAEEWNQ